MVTQSILSWEYNICYSGFMTSGVVVVFASSCMVGLAYVLTQTLVSQLVLLCIGQPYAA